MLTRLYHPRGMGSFGYDSPFKKELAKAKDFLPITLGPPKLNTTPSDTTAIPSSLTTKPSEPFVLPIWVKPAAIGAGVLVLYYFYTKMKGPSVS